MKLLKEKYQLIK